MIPRAPGQGSHVDEFGVRTDIQVRGGEVQIARVQDVEPILDLNKELAKVQQKSDWGRHYASIPMVVLERWMAETGVNIFELDGDEMDRFLRKYLDDPDWAYLRTDNKAATQWRGSDALR